MSKDDPEEMLRFSWNSRQESGAQRKGAIFMSKAVLMKLTQGRRAEMGAPQVRSKSDAVAFVMPFTSIHQVEA
ncbi:MAG: hypothetical protein WA722_16655, partial [Candidatus Sulfotelmatobacter sp.]